MRRTFFKNPPRGFRCPRVVKLSQEVDHQNIQNVAGAPSCRWRSTGVNLLRDLLGEPKTSHGRGHRNPEFRQALNSGLDQVDLRGISRP